MQPGEDWGPEYGPDITDLTGPARDPADVAGELRGAVGEDAGEQPRQVPQHPDVSALHGQLGEEFR
jgi:hypothetical protein